MHRASSRGNDMFFLNVVDGDGRSRIADRGARHRTFDYRDHDGAQRHRFRPSRQLDRRSLVHRARRKWRAGLLFAGFTRSRRQSRYRRFRASSRPSVLAALRWRPRRQLSDLSAPARSSTLSATRERMTEITVGPNPEWTIADAVHDAACRPASISARSCRTGLPPVINTGDRAPASRAVARSAPAW